MLKPRVAKHQPNLCENQHQPTWKMGWPHVQNSLSWVGLEGTFSASKPPKTQRKGSDGKCRSCPILQKCTKYIIYIYTHRNLYIYYTYIYIILLFIVVGHPQQCLAKQNFSERWVNRNPGHQGSPGVNEDLGGRLPPKKPRKLRQACEEVRKIQSETPGLRERSWEVNRPVEQAGALVPRGAFLTGSEKPRAGGKRIIHRFLLA
jgi:hypothetical protein